MIGNPFTTLEQKLWIRGVFQNMQIIFYYLPLKVLPKIDDLKIHVYHTFKNNYYFFSGWWC